MNDASKLIVWQKSLDLADKIYSITEKFPRQEVYGLSSQMQRAAVLIGSNIAEGAGRNSPREFKQFLGFFCGSASELRFQIELSQRRNYISEEQKAELVNYVDSILRMNFKLQSRIKEIIGDRSDRKYPGNAS